MPPLTTSSGRSSAPLVVDSGDKAAAANRGRAAEQLAARWLQQQGLVLVECNYHGPQGEIDLVMREAQCWVFVEVRYRASSRFGGAAGSLSRAKLDRVAATALHYLQRQHGQPLAARIDALLIEGTALEQDNNQIQWLKGVTQNHF